MATIAIAGAGGMARYLSEELLRSGYRVVILARSEKPYFQNIPGLTQEVTDYSVASLVQCIGESRALISTILDYSMQFTAVHLNLIEACKRSSSCKRFVPSEYGGNLEDYPDQPAFYYPNHEPIRAALREQSELEWTLVSVGWLIDYIIPAANRYLADIGPAFPVDLASNSIVIPGSGNELVDVTTARDLAAALVSLLSAPAWEPFTYLSGEKTTWNMVAAVMKQRIPHIAITHRSLAKLVEDIRTAADEDSRLVAEYRIFSVSNASSFDPAKVQTNRERYFEDVHFRSMRELLVEFDQNPDRIL